MIEKALKKREDRFKRGSEMAESEDTESSVWNESQRESILEGARDRLKDIVRKRQVKPTEKKPEKKLNVVEPKE